MVPGDVIGLYFPHINPIPYDDVQCYIVEEESFWFKYEPGKVNVDSEHVFRIIPATYEHPCREYAFRAIIGMWTIGLYIILPHWKWFYSVVLWLVTVLFVFYRGSDNNHTPSNCVNNT